MVNGTNLHVCFRCAGRGRYDTMHLCNNHMESLTSLTMVIWEEFENVNEISFVNEEDSSVTHNDTSQVSEQLAEIRENEDETIDQYDYDIDPPGYEEADSFPTVSSWDDYRINKTGQLIKQYSRSLIRMVSYGSTSAAEDLEAQNSVSSCNEQLNNSQ